MYWLRFFSKVAFICNLLFLLAVLLQLVKHNAHPAVVSTILILGYFLAVFVFNPLVNIFYGWLWLKKRPVFALVPRWLVLTNSLFLVLQILFIILYLNDKVNHQ